MKRLFGREYFQEEDLAERTDEFKNPARGWYRMYTLHAEEKQEPEKLCLCEEDTIAFLFFDIGAFRDRSISREALAGMECVLDHFTERGYECIVRAAYDHEGKGMDREPFYFDRVLEHLGQLGELLSWNSHSVFVYQGMLVGNWGEMHTSRFLSDEKMVRMAEILRKHRGRQTYLAVRRPSQWRLLHDKSKMEGIGDGMGLFDDGILSSESHMGTFGRESRKKVNWEDAWCRKEELEFMEIVGRWAPVGGEAVYGGGYTENLLPEQMIQELRRMQVTYLNRDYDPKILDLWKRQLFPKKGVWEKKSLYDYIGSHMGYRFFIKDVCVTPNKRERCYLVEVTIVNDGFAGFYQEAEVLLEHRRTDKAVHRCSMVYPLRGFKSGEERSLRWQVEEGEGDLLLQAVRVRDKARIYFANRADADGKVLLGRIVRRQARKR